MNQTQRLDVFRAQTENVRLLNSAWKHLRRAINANLLRDKDQEVIVHTRLLALTYCAWSEALFSKIIHTPHGFTLEEIGQIKAAAAEAVSKGWRRCVTLSLNRVRGRRDGHRANISQALNRLVDEYIHSPSLLRNKIAHGQLAVALNRTDTDINQPLSAQLSNLNVVTLDRQKAACQGLADIIEAIIESPQKGAMRDYWSLSQKITDHLERTKNFTLAKKIEQLQAKKQYQKIIPGLPYSDISGSEG